MKGDSGAKTSSSSWLVAIWIPMRASALRACDWPSALPILVGYQQTVSFVCGMEANLCLRSRPTLPPLRLGFLAHAHSRCHGLSSVHHRSRENFSTRYPALVLNSLYLLQASCLHQVFPALSWAVVSVVRLQDSLL